MIRAVWGVRSGRSRRRLTWRLGLYARGNVNRADLGRVMTAVMEDDTELLISSWTTNRSGAADAHGVRADIRVGLWTATRGFTYAGRGAYKEMRCCKTRWGMLPYL